MKKKTLYGFLLSILILGSFLRLYNLGENSFVADEFLDINSSYAYAKTSQWQAWDFNQGKITGENLNSARDERAWAYKWQVAQVLKILPLKESSARLVSAFWGIFTILLMYFVGTKFTKDKRIGLISALLFALSISGIIFDRHLRMYAMFFPIFLAFSWCLFEFLENQYAGKIAEIKEINRSLGNINIIYFIPTLILGLISFHIHQLTGNIIIIIFFYFLINALGDLWQKKVFQLNKYNFGLIALVAGFFLAKILVPAFTNSFVQGLQFFNDNYSYLSKSFRDFSNPLLAVILAGLGSYFLIKTKKMPRQSIWLATSFLTILMLAIFFWKRNVGDQYIFFALSFLMILVSAGIVCVADFFQEHLIAYKKQALIGCFVLALLLVPNYAYFFDENNTYKQNSASASPDYRKIFSYFNKKRQADDVLITRNFRNFYWKDQGVKVFDFGGELAKEKFSLAEIENIVRQNPSGWFIISENDDAYIANDAMSYIEKNFEKVSNSDVRGNILLYRWGYKK